jgi:hypothetical protein
VDRVIHARALHARETDGLASHALTLDATLQGIDFGRINSGRRNPIFGRYPLSLQNRLKELYIATAGRRCAILFGDARWAAVAAGLPTDSWQRADQELERRDRALRRARVDVALDDFALSQAASDHAQHCMRVRMRHAPASAFEILSAYARQHGIGPPTPVRGITLAGCLNRMESPRWWRRAMRRTYSRTAEEGLRALGFVNRRASLYVSHEALALRIAQRSRNVAALSDAVATNDRNESFTLIDLASTSTSNPAIRRAELMVRCRGMEEQAKRAGYVAALFVCTLPSRFHVCTGDHRNPNFDGSSPRAGHRWLCRKWERLRAQLHRRGIPIYGLRTVEPHHDGTPHWNVLIFCRPNDLTAIEGGFRRHFLLSDSPNEPGATEHRVHTTCIDPDRGGATAYIAKYIAKNVDGYRVGADYEDTDRKRAATETSVRVDAWASIHGIRQFQQFGAPPVTVWRELRRIRCGVTDGVIEHARRAADGADWAAFTSAMESGPPQPNGWAIELYKVWSDKPGVFGDPAGYVVRGIKSDLGMHVTRDRAWTTEWMTATTGAHRLQ